VAFSWRRRGARSQQACLECQAEGDGQNGEQDPELFRVCHMGVFQPQAAAFQAGEERFYPPALAVCGQRRLWPARGEQDQKLSGLELHDNDPGRRSGLLALLPETPLAFERALFPFPQASCHARQRHAGVLFIPDIHVVLQPQNVRNIVFLQPPDPRVADKLAVPGQAGNLLIRENAPHPGQQVDSLIRIRVSGLVQHRPEQRHAHAVMDDPEHQDIDMRLAELPVGPVQRQLPRFSRKPRKVNRQPRYMRFVKPHMLEKPHQTPVDGIFLRRAVHVRGQTP
jgi:hypothetical protein